MVTIVLGEGGSIGSLGRPIELGGVGKAGTSCVRGDDVVAGVIDREGVPRRCDTEATRVFNEDVERVRECAGVVAEPTLGFLLFGFVALRGMEFDDVVDVDFAGGGVGVGTLGCTDDEVSNVEIFEGTSGGVGGPETGKEDVTESFGFCRDRRVFPDGCGDASEGGHLVSFVCGDGVVGVIVNGEDNTAFIARRRACDVTILEFEKPVAFKIGRQVTEPGEAGGKTGVDRDALGLVGTLELGDVNVTDEFGMTDGDGVTCSAELGSTIANGRGNCNGDATGAIVASFNLGDIWITERSGDTPVATTASSTVGEVDSWGWAINEDKTGLVATTLLTTLWTFGHGSRSTGWHGLLSSGIPANMGTGICG